MMSGSTSTGSRFFADLFSGFKAKAGTLVKNTGLSRKESYQCFICGHDLKPGDKTCPACRSSAENKMSTSVCKNCGCRIPSGSRYCIICGSRQD